VQWKEPHSGGTAFLITVISTPGKYEFRGWFELSCTFGRETLLARNLAKLARSNMKCLNQIIFNFPSFI